MSTIWLNGRLLSGDEPVLRADDHGLLVGDGIFETAKVVDGVAFALTRHLARLRRSAAGLGLEL
ncbi:MAG TPA: aminotransferase class IV, partial [Acidimicrobiales bacterium]|nr:aminotransferase class IV [Acidimicrobiales bacterium]